MSRVVVTLAVLALVCGVAQGINPDAVKSDLNSLADTLVDRSRIWLPTHVPGVAAYSWDGSDRPCHARKGHCGTTCENGKQVSRLCGGSSGRRCCVPNQGVVFQNDLAEKRCSDALGICGNGPCKGGAVTKGLCPGTARCCINGLPGTQYSSFDRSAKQAATNRFKGNGNYGPFRDGYRFGGNHAPQQQKPGPWRSNLNPTNWITSATRGKPGSPSGFNHFKHIVDGYRNKEEAPNRANTNAPKPPPLWLTQVGKYTVEKLDRSTRKRLTTFSGPANKFLLHTIEGAWPRNGDYEGGTRTLDRHGYWPHFILARDRQGVLKIGQYIPLNVGGRALERHNAELNIQVEIGAKADKPFTSNDQEITDATAALWCALHKATRGAIPLSVDPKVQFRKDRAYGRKAPQRLSRTDFKNVRGLVGHQHAPDNSHWDPGAIDPQVLVNKAQAMCR